MFNQASHTFSKPTFRGRSGYSFTFNGKEKDREVDGQQDYGMRIYDKRLSRFKSVDPITKEYPNLTPYQFASNNSIAGIDLDGLEFLSNEDARIEIRNGGIFLKVSNFISTSIPQQNLDLRNWKGGIGVNTQIGAFNAPLPPVAMPKDIPGDHLPSLNKGQGTTKDLLGKYGKSTTGMVNSPARPSKSIAIAEVVMFGMDLAANLLNSYDLSLVEAQKTILLQATDILQSGLENGMVDKKYYNTNDMSDILNVILSGESTSGNTEIVKIGMDIYNKYAQPKEIVRKSGLDGVPDTKIISTPIVPVKTEKLD